MKDLRVYMKTAGLVVKCWREEAGLSQLHLAELASVITFVSAQMPPLSADDVRNIERGIIKRFADIRRICIVLRKSVSDFSPAVEAQLERAEALLRAETQICQMKEKGLLRNHSEK